MALDARTYGKRAKPPTVDHHRLAAAVSAARQVLAPYRRHRFQAVKHLAAARYSDTASEHEIPLNLIAKYVRITSRSLVSKTPRVMLSTRDRAALPAVSVMQQWMNEWLRRSHFEQVLQRYVVDALLCLGVMKVGIAAPHDYAALSYAAPVGEPFAECIDLDDFVVDPACRDLRHATFVGHRFRIPLDVATELDYFDAKARKGLSADHPSYANEDGEERIQNVGREVYDAAEFEDHTTVWEIYLPRQRRVLTYGSRDGLIDPELVLRNDEWVGPNCGPYHFLGMGVVPGNFMPKAPVPDLMTLSEQVNSLYRKLMNQARDQKTILPVRAGSEDGQRIKDARDGDIIHVDNPDAPRPIDYGGPNAVNANFAVHLLDLFNKFGDNLDLQAGTGAQSKTATQDRILNENSAAGVADMQAVTVAAFGRVLESVGWYLWYNPQLVMSVTKSLPGLPNVSIERRLGPAGSGEAMRREGPYEKLALRIDPHSLAYRSPAQRMQSIDALVRNLLPMMQLLQQQGVLFDVQAYLDRAEEYMDEPDVRALFTTGSADGGGTTPAPSEEGPPKPAATTREYVRRSESNGDAQQRADYEASMEEASGEAFQ